MYLSYSGFINISDNDIIKQLKLVRVDMVSGLRNDEDVNSVNVGDTRLQHVVQCDRLYPGLLSIHHTHPHVISQLWQSLQQWTPRPEKVVTQTEIKDLTFD